MFKQALLVLLIAASGYLLYSYAVPCQIPVTYRVGAVDARFNLSDEALRAALEDAEAIWEGPAGVELFRYGDAGKVPVNLVYDTRQAITQSNNTIKQDIDRTTDSADTVKRAYDAANAGYENAKAEYVAAEAAYEAQLKAYNERVAYWNARGGAPQSEYRALQTQKAAVESASRALEADRVALNQRAEQVNALSTRYNDLAARVNSGVDAINRTAGREFEEGLYTRTALGSRIDIFEYSDRAELVRVLAHELGHALGLEHNNNPDSIMYELNESENAEPTEEDLSALRATCRLR